MSRGTVRYELQGFGKHTGLPHSWAPNFPQGLWSSAPSALPVSPSYSSAHTLYSNPWNLHLLECSLSSYIRAFVWSLSSTWITVSPGLHLENSDFCREPQVSQTAKMSANSRREVICSLHSHSALLITLSQHLTILHTSYWLTCLLPLVGSAPEILLPESIAECLSSGRLLAHVSAKVSTRDARKMCPHFLVSDCGSQYWMVEYRRRARKYRGKWRENFCNSEVTL